MKEVVKSTAVVLEVFNPVTKEMFRTKGENIIQNRYYSIKNLTSRVNSMDLIETLATICRSSKDMRLLGALLDYADSDNKIVMTNMAEEARNLNINKSKLSVLLRLSCNANLLKKITTGTYLINPYILIGKRVRSNEKREQLQIEWVEAIKIGNK